MCFVLIELVIMGKGSQAFATQSLVMGSRVRTIGYQNLCLRNCLEENTLARSLVGQRNCLRQEENRAWLFKAKARSRSKLHEKI